MKIKERQAWRNTFGSPDGKAVLTDILNRLGMFADDPAYIDPKLIAMGNWMLKRIGSLTISNLEAYTKAIIDCGGLQDTEKEGENSNE